MDSMYSRCLESAYRVEFLTKKWEIRLYANMLYEAYRWGEKKTQDNKEYFSKNHLIDKYNI